MNARSLKALLIASAIVALLVALWAMKSSDNASSPGTAAAPETRGASPFKTEPSLAIAEHSGMLVNSDGRVWMWGGRNTYDLVEPPTREQKHLPNELKGVDRVVSASMVEGYALALRDDGSVWGIGNTAGGQIGLIIPDGRQYTTQWMEVDGLKDVVQVVASYYVSLVLKSDGTVWGAGINEWGRLGEDYAGPISRVHVQLAHLNGIRQIGASGETFFAVRNDGKVLVWGYRHSLGLPSVQGARKFITVPEVINGLDNVVAVARKRASHRILAQRADGSVVLWHGDGIENCEGNREPIFIIEAFQDAVSIADSPIYVYAVKADGSFWQFSTADVYKNGCKPAEQLLPPESAAAVDISGTSFALLMRDGSVQVWGNTLGIWNRSTSANSLSWENRQTIEGIVPRQSR